MTLSAGNFKLIQLCYFGDSGGTLIKESVTVGGRAKRMLSM